uniref:MARVEL domain-containing protein n=1 Tax=Leptobrachium leishanense TaxID=445787 RepID=A0A8C5PI03_9ANUR
SPVIGAAVPPAALYPGPAGRGKPETRINPVSAAAIYPGGAPPGGARCCGHPGRQGAPCHCVSLLCLLVPGDGETPCCAIPSHTAQTLPLYQHRGRDVWSFPSIPPPLSLSSCNAIWISCKFPRVPAHPHRHGLCPAASFDCFLLALVVSHSLGMSEQDEPRGCGSNLLDSDFLRSLKGRILLLELVLCFVVFVCFAATLSSYLAAPLFEFIITLIFIILLSSQYNQRLTTLNWPCMIFGFFLVCVFCYDAFAIYKEEIREQKTETSEGV